MINYEVVKKDVHVSMSITCDKCRMMYTDPLELQEFHHIDFIGGYGSVFGDEVQVHYDICQHCLYKMVGGIERE